MLGHTISIEIPDEDRHTGKSNLNISAPIICLDMVFPINWSGRLNGENILIEQLNDHCTGEDDLIFKIYPLKYNYLRSNIRKAIHRKMNILN